MPYPFNQNKLDMWCKGLEADVAKEPDAWDMYDDQIRLSLAIYTAHLRTVLGYIEPDANKVKAMVWTETGAWRKKDWGTAPIQIGVNGDPGLHDLLTKPSGRLILPQQYQLVFNESNVPLNGNLNIAAGIGYLLKNLAKFGMVPEEQIAPLPFTSMQPITKPAAIMGPLQHVRSAPHKPKLKYGITGWRIFDFPFAARHYNLGDGNYLGKLQFAYDMITAK